MYELNDDDNVEHSNSSLILHWISKQVGIYLMCAQCCKFV